MKTSGFCIASGCEWGCYPYIESIESFLPTVDEMVVVYNPYSKDGTNEKLEELGDKIRMVPAYFDLEGLGWLSYAIARTTGYQACNGEMVLMFDVDGILHEKDIEKVKEQTKQLRDSQDFDYGYWGKLRIYKTDWGFEQNKHSGIYKKIAIGDNLHFYADDRRGIPAWKEDPGRGMQFDVRLFGYEHIWDTEDVVKAKAVRYNRMAIKINKGKLLSEEEVWKEYMRGIKECKKPKRTFRLEDHPKIIQEKLKGLNESYFGFNWFE